MDPEGVKSQVEVLTSGDLLKQVSDRLNLTDSEAFTSTNIKPWTRVLILLGMRNNPASLTPEERVLQKLRQNLQVFNVTGSRVIVVSIRPQMRRRLPTSQMRWLMPISRCKLLQNFSLMMMQPGGLRQKLRICAAKSGIRKEGC